MAKRNRKRSVDFKAAAANDDTPVEEPKPRVTAEEIVNASATAEPITKPSVSAEQMAKPSATATGARYAVLAGRPSKQGVIAVFGNTGYALSWVARAIRLGVTPEELCQRFKSEPEAVKAAWDALKKTA